MKKLILTLLCLSLTYCVSPKYLGSFNITMKSTNPPIALSQSVVRGEHCEFDNFYSHSYPKIDLAFMSAVAKSPTETKGLKDVKIEWYIEGGWGLFWFLVPISPLLGWPAGKQCFIVSGIPAKLE